MAEVIHDAAENHVNGFDQLDNLKHQMELRGSELGKTWAELSRIMSQYQNQLIQKHDNYKTNLSTDDQHRVAKLETVIEKKALQIQQLEKANDDLSTRLLEKDSEIVRLRTEVHQSKNEVSMKDALIDKLQSQMAKEALEYQTEVTSLKEMLVQGVTSEVTSREQTEEGDGTGATNLTPTTPGPGGKRRRLAPSKAVTSTPVSVTSASTSSHASDELLLQASIRTVTFPSSASSDALNPQTLTSRPAFPDSLTSASIDEPLEMEAYGGFTEDEENYYKGEEVSEDSLARFELEEADSSQLDMSGQETVECRNFKTHCRNLKTQECRSSKTQGKTKNSKVRKRLNSEMKTPAWHQPFFNNDNNNNNNRRGRKRKSRNNLSETNRNGTENTCKTKNGSKPSENESNQNETETGHYNSRGRGKCPKCHKVINLTNLRRHLRVHTGEKPYVCQACGRSFVTSFEARMHSKMHHCADFIVKG